MDLKKRAKTLPKHQRRKILMDYKETDLHKCLRELFQVMEPSYTVEITHGAQEYGKDLIMVRSDRFTKEAIGVVVKCGNINGKTLGDVDDLKEHVKCVLSKGAEIKLAEIKSQIEQALAHAATAKSYLEELPVSKVYAVIAGEFSKNARKRLTNELAAEIEIFDLNWLVDNFTEFYPQIFFEGMVIDFLDEKTRELEEAHRRGKSGKTLSEYFVNPLVRSFSAPFEFDAKTIGTLLKKRKFPFERLLKISKERKKLILLGDPGTGKTGAMAKLAIDAYHDAYNRLLKRPGKPQEKIPVPALVHARTFLVTDSAENFLTEYFESTETQRLFKVDLILVDGLDEVESQNRNAVVDKLDEFSNHIGCSYIVTSRKIDVISTLSEEYHKYELLPFEFNQAFTLVSRLINDTTLLKAMQETLEKIQAQILLVPLSLMLLVELVEENREVPASVTELYDRFFDMALGKEDYQKRGITVLFDYLIKKKFLGALAYNAFVENDTLEITSRDFQQFLNSYAAQYGWSEKALNDFVPEIERAGILDHREHVRFKHRSFLDYFAAFNIYENRGDIAGLNELIVNTYFNDIWSEIAFFYIGLRREISRELLEGIYTYRGEGFTVDLFKLLGGRLLQAGWHSTTEQHENGIRQAISYALQIKNRFQEMITNANSDIPGILSDFLTLVLADLSFNSGFLESHIKTILTELIDSSSHDDTYLAVILIGTIRRFLSRNEVEAYINDVLQELSKLESPENQARILLLMELIEEDKAIIKLIKRQSNRLQKRAPHIFKALLPAKRKGFR